MEPFAVRAQLLMLLTHRLLHFGCERLKVSQPMSKGIQIRTYV